MPEQLAHFDATKLLTRVFMILFLLLAALGTWFAVRWYLGDLVAEYHDPDEHGMEMATRAVAWAPDDPMTHWKLGAVAQRKLLPDQLTQVVSEYEKAASLSPNDYRFWVPLGTALEQWGDVNRGEKALRRATELAPAYAFPRWHLGNLLLRSGRYDEAFEELRRASEADPTLRGQLLNLAWEVYNKDLESFTRAVGTSPGARAELAAYLVSRSRLDDGILLWRGLSETEKRVNRLQGDAIVGTLVATKHYHQAVEIANDLVPAPAYRAAEGQFVDGGFDDNLSSQSGSVFGWKVKSEQQAQVGIDPNRGHSSSRSLRIVFQVRSRLDSLSIGQLVPVRPGAEYDFECYIKTEKLQSGSTPQIEIFDATQEAVLAVSDSAASGNTDWQRVAMSFKVGPKTEAVIVKIIRSPCEDPAVCPIFGSVWYDDFNFKRRG